MASNRTLIEVKDRGWLNGFGSLWRKENRGARGKWSWVIQILIWIAIIDGMLVLTMSNSSTGSSAELDLFTFFIFAGIAAAIGVTILGQEAILDERKMGTAAWILSKPVSRTAFLLSKLSAGMLRMLVTMVLLQGFIAFFLLKIKTSITLSIPGFLAGMGLVYLFLIFILTLTLMLSTLFRSRGPVIGIPLVFVVGSQFWTGIPWLGKYMPTSIILGGGGSTSMPVTLALGQPLTIIEPILTTGLLILIFSIVTLVRFKREEF